jgi:eukaryotic-like serine/threonine-protein kinase
VASCQLAFVKEAIQSRNVARFESFEVNLQSGELLKNGDRVKLPEQSFQILAMLLERPGEVVMRQEIQKRLWPNDTVVEFENSINAAIKRLRTALDDSADRPRYIETLARRGYRWKIPVEWVEPSPTQAVANEPIDYSASRLIGKRVSHYRVLEILGGGGMGLVYKAEDIKLGRRVALKFLPEELATGAAALQRFEREARAASALNDPNICTIHAIEEYEGQPFIVMELLEGQTLREMIASEDSPNKHFPEDKLLDIATQIASGLDAAHKNGIIHRDIKPANIFVTTNGRVKILDFGLAKLQHSELEEPESPQKTEHQSSAEWNPHTTLTRTGVTIGTAGYMSPEQIRGEKVDTRTDLFSFGLVLYEMAAGQRAFSGDTAPVLENAILHHEPTPLRELNRASSQKLEAVISKALEKDRDKRYQNVSEMRTDLETIKRAITPRKPFRKWLFAAGTLVTIAIGSAIFWSAMHLSPAAPGPSDVKLTQLTANSAENPVSGGAISPDGRYLAYTDLQGMHIKLAGSDDAQAVPQPAELKKETVIWEIGPWFPDSKRFVVHSHPAPVTGDDWFSASTSNWIVSVLGGAPQKLRDNAYVWDVSPDGSRIAFGTNFDLTAETNPGDETWLMSSDGTNASRLFPRGQVCCVHFLPDGKRIAYEYNEALVASDLEGGPPITLLSSSEKKKLGFGERMWLPDGSLLETGGCRWFMRPDAPCNFWVERRDLKTGKPLQPRRRLTNWVGASLSGPSVTSDGKRMAFLQSSSRGVGYLADLSGNGTQVVQSRRFPLEEGGEDSISSWTFDGKNAIVSQRRSNYGALRLQSLNSNEQVTIMTSEDASAGIAESSLSPDGKWVIFLAPVADNVTINTPAHLMRVPISGGGAEPIFTMRQGSSFSCARPPSDVCVVAEESQDRKTLIVTNFDPVRGRGAELARFELDNPPNIGDSIEHVLLFDISPDGNRLAVSRSEHGPIEIRSFHGNHSFVIPEGTAHRPKNMKFIKWAADGRALIISSDSSQGGEILRLDLQGNSSSLWKCASWCMGTPSPDGRHLGIYNQTVSANMWMMENF